MSLTGTDAFEVSIYIATDSEMAIGLTIGSLREGWWRKGYPTGLLLPTGEKVFYQDASCIQVGCLRPYPSLILCHLPVSPAQCRGATPGREVALLVFSLPFQDRRMHKT